jgi:hypothetical protein
MCAIFAVRVHKKINPEANLRSIPVTNEYPYLEVLIDDSGSIASQLNRML